MFSAQSNRKSSKQLQAVATSTVPTVHISNVVFEAIILLVQFMKKLNFEIKSKSDVGT